MISDHERALRLCEALCPGTNEMRFAVLEGAPHSKARHRHTKTGRTYKLDEDRCAERITSLRLSRLVTSPLHGNLALACIFFRSNKQRIDCDNMLKHICDAANSILWHDDSQVTAIMGIVEFDAVKPRTIVMVGQHESTLVRDIATPISCAHCGKQFLRKKSSQVICSKACRESWQVGRNRSRAIVLDPKCRVCGAAVSRPEVIRCRSCWAVRARETEITE